MKASLAMARATYLAMALPAKLTSCTKIACRGGLAMIWALGQDGNLGRHYSRVYRLVGPQTTWAPGHALPEYPWASPSLIA